MRQRTPVRLPTLRALWNVGLALFSMLALTRVLPPLLVEVGRGGLISTLCAPPERGIGNGAPGLWLWLFVVSKLAELFDTAFLVLQRKPLSLLHVWHHASVLIWAWHQFVARTGPSVFFSAMNLTVHAAMYAYFAVADFVEVPRKVAMGITCCQVCQIVAGLVLTVGASIRQHRGGECAFGDASAALSFAIYLSYLALFLQFADEAYGLRLRLVRAVATMRAARAAGGGSAPSSAENDVVGRPWRRVGLSLDQRFEAACSAAPLYLGVLQVHACSARIGCHACSEPCSACNP